MNQFPYGILATARGGLANWVTVLGLNNTLLTYNRFNVMLQCINTWKWSQFPRRIQTISLTTAHPMVLLLRSLNVDNVYASWDRHLIFCLSCCLRHPHHVTVPGFKSHLQNWLPDHEHAGLWLGLCHPLWRLDWVAGSWLHPCPVLATVDIHGMNQQTGMLALLHVLPTFEIKKKM